MQQLLGRIKIKIRLYLIVLLAFIAIITLEVKSLAQERDLLLESRQNNVSDVVETVYGIIDYYYQLSQTQKLSIEEAQQAALATVQNLRYDSDDYFWINDMQPKMLMHPTNPGLIGKDLSTIKDPNGKYLFNEFVEQVGDKGEGFVDYHWPKPGMQEPVPKISFVKRFAPWDWVVGSGIYIDDIDTRMTDEIFKSAIIATIVALIILGLSSLIAYSILCPIMHLKDILHRVKNTGDISQRLELESEAEFREIVDSFNQILENFHQTTLKVDDSVNHMNHSISDLSEIVSTTTKGVEHQQQKLKTINTSMQELNSNIDEVTQSSRDGHQIANETNSETQQGKVLVTQTIQSITQLADALKNASQVVNQLEQDSNNIGSVVDVIRSVSEQTNLLALNAAIEAARAGEYGRGFAVVADEVRTLAQKTQESTTEIQTMIDALQNGANDVVELIKNSHIQADDSVEISTKTGTALDSIAEKVATMNQYNEQISASSSHQHQVAGDMYQNLEDINQQAQADLEGVQQVNKASTDLASLSKQLQEMMAAFHH